MKKDGLYGYIDKSGKWVIEPQYELADSFRNGQALVRLNGKIGLIDRWNRMTVTPQYDKEYSIMKGSAYETLFYSPYQKKSQGMRIRTRAASLITCCRTAQLWSKSIKKPGWPLCRLSGLLVLLRYCATSGWTDALPSPAAPAPRFSG